MHGLELAEFDPSGKQSASFLGMTAAQKKRHKAGTAGTNQLFQSKLKMMLHYAQNERSDDLMEVNGWEKIEGVLMTALNRRPVNIGDIENMLCKAVSKEYWVKIGKLLVSCNSSLPSGENAL